MLVRLDYEKLTNMKPNNQKKHKIYGFSTQTLHRFSVNPMKKCNSVNRVTVTVM